MATPQEIRNIRLKNDFQEMKNIRGSIINWEILKGVQPHVEEYKLTVNVRCIIGPTPTYRSKHEIKLVIPDDYPIKAAPIATMLTKPYPYHPNWFESGRWCYGTWNIAEGLGHYVIRMVRTLLYDVEITNERSPANGAANDWFKRNRNNGLFPSDKLRLPDPIHKKKFNINRFKINNQ